VSWLTDYVRPRIRALYTRESKPEVPENLWQACPECERMIFHRDLEQNQRVCPHCSHHMRIGPEHRFRALLDEDSWTRVEVPKAPVDPLRFRDQKKYVDRLKEAQARLKVPDALEVAAGTVDGLPVVVAVMNFEFMAGTMGGGLGEAFVTAAREAVRRRAAFVVVTASGGARMQEGRHLADADGADHDRRCRRSRRPACPTSSCSPTPPPAASPPPSRCWATSTWPSPAP
jgi:acetyl-CoA carboxylase carboxyl transferase subunit beta